MADDRLVQRLEEQLRDAHSTNADLRERLGDVEQREREADARLARASFYYQQLEKAHAVQKAAEDNAAAAQRKQVEAEREALSARGEIEELHARLNRLQAEANMLNELNARVEAARHVRDLIAPEGSTE
jgi:chromosome segregation ATPase